MLLWYHYAITVNTAERSLDQFHGENISCAIVHNPTSLVF